MRLGGGLGVGVDALVAEKNSANLRMASMIWAPKLAKDAAGAGLERAADRRLDASVAPLAEYIAVMALLWEKLYCFGCAFSPRLRNVNTVASAVEWGRDDVPSFLAMELPCASMLQDIMDEDFRPWWGHGGLVAFKHPV